MILSLMHAILNKKEYDKILSINDTQGVATGEEDERTSLLGASDN
jgi:hypothetical protein